MAAGCMSSASSTAVKENLERPVKEDAGLEDRVEVRGVGCMKLCCEGPLVGVIRNGSTALREGLPEDAPAIVGALKGGKTCSATRRSQHPFFQANAIVLANSGIVDPERIEAYIAADGYQALHDGAARDDAGKDVVEP
jgi:bidirectional [NiFe] hydrogenase diaphorase subunit